MNSRYTLSTGILRAALILGGLAVAGSVWLQALPQLMQRGCWVGEWPFDQGCGTYATRALPKTTASEYQNHLQRNPGDARAWVPFAVRLWQDQDQRAEAVLAAVRALDPYNIEVQRMEAASAAHAGDGERLAAALVNLAERGVGEAYKPLQALMQSPETQGHVLKLLTPETRWLDAVLSHPDRAMGSDALIPFVSEGLRLNILKQATVLNMVEHLKKVGMPIDAYALWLQLKGHVAEGLFNNGFEQRVTQKGFDWMWPMPAPNSLAGARVAQVSAAPRAGQMLEVTLTGKTALPTVLVQQTLVLLNSQYRLSIQTSVETLKTEQGLVWGLYCYGGHHRWAQTAPIKATTTGISWQAYKVEFEVPAECGGVVDLRLEPAASCEVKAGMTGLVHFDDFELVALTRG